MPSTNDEDELESAEVPRDRDRDPNAKPAPTLGEFEVTQELPQIAQPGFADVTTPKAVDLWNEPTPPDLPDAPKEIEPRAPEEEESPYTGDGPFAAPLDRPRQSSNVGRVVEESSRSRDRSRLPPARTVSQLQRESLASTFSAPLVVQRRTGRLPSTPGRPQDAGAASMSLAPRARASSSAGAPARRSVSGVSSPAPERKYPKMRALLESPDEVPHGSGSPPRSRTRPVPGTFFPAPREREAAPVRAAPADLDEMLATMAEGLLIGEGPAGETEVRVTLRDEFFAGTELRIIAGDGRVRAVLIPPDRGTYLTLNGNIDELRARLEARGLRIEELRVAEP